MSNIQSAGGLSSPGFQPASSKGDGGGNGGGGMFFGGGQEEEFQQPDWLSSPFNFHPPADLKDIPFIPVALGQGHRPGLKLWKLALAEQLYTDWKPIPVEALN